MLNGSDQRLSAEDLANHLRGKREGNYWKAHCPAHDDAHCSLSISEGGDGKVLVKCHAGCTQESLIGALRGKGFWPQRMSNGARQRARMGRVGRIVAVYDYTDAMGNLLFQTVRYEPKTFRQRRPDGDGGYIWNLKGVHPVLYRLPDLIEAVANGHKVAVVEGEKDVDNLAKIGIAATCNHGGAGKGKWKPAVHGAHLKGANVIVIPDNDQPGRDHARSIAHSLKNWAADVRLLELPNLLPGGDVSDWLGNGGTADQLWALVDQAPEAATTTSGKQGRSASSDDDPPHWHVEPWSEPVSGAELLNDICKILRRHMVLPRHAAEAMALWVLHAWTMDAWEISPILIIVSPVPQCGKSTLMTLLYWMTPRSELFSNATASPIFRLIEDAKPAIPTLLLDEGDSYLKPDKEDLRGILNSGWMHAAARVIRTEGDGRSGRKARRYSTWAAKAIATIKAVADTLMDRGVIVLLRRKAKGEEVERFRMRDTNEFQIMRSKILRWASDNVETLREADPKIPDELHNRPADNWRGLFGIADAIGGDHWPKRAREAALAMSGNKKDDDAGIALLRDIKKVFDENDQASFGAEALVQQLINLPETPWAEWRRGEKPITSRGVAKMLAVFDIYSDDKHRPRLYWAKDFAVAWSAYLPIPPVPSGTSPTFSTGCDERRFLPT
jgi:5S rRNA maturation endonuclease (ribonuclease M5)